MAAKGAECTSASKRSSGAAAARKTPIILSTVKTTKTTKTTRHIHLGENGESYELGLNNWQTLIGDDGPKTKVVKTKNVLTPVNGRRRRMTVNGKRKVKKMLPSPAVKARIQQWSESDADDGTSDDEAGRRGLISSDDKENVEMFTSQIAMSVQQTMNAVEVDEFWSSNATASAYERSMTIEDQASVTRHQTRSRTANLRVENEVMTQEEIDNIIKESHSVPTEVNLTRGEGYAHQKYLSAIFETTAEMNATSFVPQALSDKSPIMNQMISSHLEQMHNSTPKMNNSHLQSSEMSPTYALTPEFVSQRGRRTTRVIEPISYPMDMQELSADGSSDRTRSPQAAAAIEARPKRKPKRITKTFTMPSLDAVAVAGSSKQKKTPKKRKTITLRRATTKRQKKMDPRKLDRQSTDDGGHESGASTNATAMEAPTCREEPIENVQPMETTEAAANESWLHELPVTATSSATVSAAESAPTTEPRRVPKRATKRNNHLIQLLSDALTPPRKRRHTKRHTENRKIETVATTTREKRSTIPSRVRKTEPISAGRAAKVSPKKRSKAAPASVKAKREAKTKLKESLHEPTNESNLVIDDNIAEEQNAQVDLPNTSVLTNTANPTDNRRHVVVYSPTRDRSLVKHVGNGERVIVPKVMIARAIRNPNSAVLVDLPNKGMVVDANVRLVYSPRHGTDIDLKEELSKGVDILYVLARRRRSVFILQRTASGAVENESD